MIRKGLHHSGNRPEPFFCCSECFCLCFCVFLVLHFLLMLRCVLLVLFRFYQLAILCATQGSRESQRHSHTCTRWRGHSITSRFPNRREFWHYETSYQMHTPSRGSAKPSNHFRKPGGKAFGNMWSKAGFYL